MVSKNILIAAVIVVILVAGGGFYLLQQSKPAITPTPTTPTLTPTQTPTPTPTPTETQTPTPTPTSTPTPTVTNEDLIKEMVEGYYDAFNRHSVKDEVAFFTKDGTKMLNHGRDGTWKGHEQITKQLTDVFKFMPDIALVDQEITKLSIKGDTATVQIKYRGYAKNWQDDTMVEYMELVRVEGVWKIAKTDVVY